MASSSKQTYLAAKYMSGPKADAILAKSPSYVKKKKPRSPAIQADSALRLLDNDLAWAGSMSVTQDDDEDAISRGDVVVASDRTFKKRSTERDGSGWETIRAVTPPPDDGPLIVDSENVRPAGGILSKTELALMHGSAISGSSATPPQEETVYRDNSGRKIDAKAERAAIARKLRLKEEKDAQKMEWGKGLVQKDSEERRQQELEREKTRDLARYADDGELNEHQKQQTRWNDPAAAFLTKTTSALPRRPIYSGPPPPPNRFGIQPGHRWDGVDRSNGFERKLFQSGNERTRTNLEGYQWRSEDM